ncbi:hypothetical protein [Streptomyces sp. NPDC050504]|uniref:hypothetical protein n=1 Tax=Streptomyces sp. NPDC050504 TaxID=3365618 RepID=UPI0037B55583
MSKNIAARTATAVVTAALAATGVLVGAGTASAGSNGQQIIFRDKAMPNYRHSVELYGYNHNGEETLGCFNINSGGTTYISGWWWRGPLTVKSYNSYNCQNSYSWGTNISVPYSQSDDWVTVTGY